MKIQAKFNENSDIVEIGFTNHTEVEVHQV